MNQPEGAQQQEGKGAGRAWGGPGSPDMFLFMISLILTTSLGSRIIPVFADEETPEAQSLNNLLSCNLVKPSI